jgi:hypothetical protein
LGSKADVTAPLPHFRFTRTSYNAHQPLATGILARESLAVCIENAGCALTVGPATLDAINAR